MHIKETRKKKRNLSGAFPNSLHYVFQLAYYAFPYTFLINTILDPNIISRTESGYFI